MRTAMRDAFTTNIYDRNMRSLAGKATRLINRRGTAVPAYSSSISNNFLVPSSASNVSESRCSYFRSCLASFSTEVHDDTNISSSDHESYLETSITDSVSPAEITTGGDPAVVISKNNKTVTLRYDNMMESANFHAAWLWANDPAHCHPSSGQKLKSLCQYDPTTAKIMSAKIVQMKNDKISFLPSPPGSLHPRGGIYKTVHDSTEKKRDILEIVWQSGEKSSYDLEWLSRFTSNTSQADSRRVTKEVAIGARDNSDCVAIPTFDYVKVMENDLDESTLFQVLDNILKHGAVLIQNAPAASATSDEDDESIVANLGRRICGSNLSHGSLYGDVFHVKSMPDAHNIAYTSVALPPHQDLTYYESKPFLQLLHTVQNAPTTIDDKGRGESVLIDAMAAVEHLRRVAPDVFQTLCTVEATFCKQREGADMASAKPHIVTSPYDQSVTSVNWSPPFEGPLQLPPSRDIVQQERLMDDYVMAYQAMECLLDNHSPSAAMLPVYLEQELREYAQNYTWEYALKEGEILVFNNQRMLHGRRRFSLPEGTNKHRHLIGCYTDAMDTLSHYRLLLRQQQSQDAGGSKTPSRSGSRNAGNGSRAIFLR
jgi:alpha-ketoglutarate-dependent taurine dioxygenase